LTSFDDLEQAFFGLFPVLCPLCLLADFESGIRRTEGNVPSFSLVLFFFRVSSVSIISRVDLRPTARCQVLFTLWIPSTPCLPEESFFVSPIAGRLPTPPLFYVPYTHIHVCSHFHRSQKMTCSLSRPPCRVASFCRLWLTSFFSLPRLVA